MTGSGTGEGATEVSHVLASVAASEPLHILSTPIRITGDWDLSDNCFQNAVARALTSWPERDIRRGRHERADKRIR